jgi:hypothetical protein
MPSQSESEDQHADGVRRAMIARALDEAHILEAAQGDGIARGVHAFAGRVIEPLPLHQWVLHLKVVAPHLFAPPEPPSTPEQPGQIDWWQFPPMERLTKFREAHPELSQRRQRP